VGFRADFKVSEDRKLPCLYRDSNHGSTKPERKKHRKILNTFCHFQCDLAFPQKFRTKFCFMLEGSDQYTFLD